MALALATHGNEKVGSGAYNVPFTRESNADRRLRHLCAKTRFGRQ